jgi:hypothetical protein
MSINPDKIKIGEELGRIITFSFVYKSKNGKTYEGTLTITANNVGGMYTEDYEVIWSDKDPPEYESDKDDEKIYDAYLNGK